MRLTHLLSNHIDYPSFTSPDAGYEYAKSLNLENSFLNDFSKEINVYLIDNRITEKDCEALYQIIKKHPYQLFIIKLIDPYAEYTVNHWYYQFAFKCIKHSNCTFLSIYTPTETIKLLADAVNKERLLVLPYPYRTYSEKEKLHFEDF